MILSSHGLLVTHIDKNYKMTRWTLSEIMAMALKPASAMMDTDPDQVKFNQRLVDKLKYCKEVLVSIRTASANGTAVPEETGETPAGGMGMPSGNLGSLGVSTRPSKASLR